VAGAPSRRGVRWRRVAVAITVLALSVASIGAVSAPAVAASAGRDTAKGTALVEQFFDLLKAGDTKGLAQLLSPAFLLQGADGGVLDKEDFVANPSKVAA